MISKMFFTGFLISMFVLRYFYVQLNIEAIKRIDIIHKKNSLSYDRLNGAITMTFFPINILLLPLYIPLLLIKSERLNDTILKF